MAEAKTISGHVRSIILAVTQVTGWAVLVVQAQQARHLNDPDGITTHSVLTFRFNLETI